MKPILLLPSSPEYRQALVKILEPGFRDSWFTPAEGADPELLLDDPRFAEQVYLVLLDMAPDTGYNAMRFLAKLKSSARTCRIPVCVIASQPHPTNRLKCIAMGVDHYFGFPVWGQELLLWIDRIIDHYLENRNIHEALLMINRMKESELHHESAVKQDLEKYVNVQDSIMQMSRQELLDANRKMHEYYETQLQALREKSALQLLFGKYISPSVLDYLMHTDGQRTLHGEKRDVSVLFCDLRGFTPLSERLEPAKVVILLNEFFTELSETIIRHQGMVDKYAGDNIMAVFGAPVPLEHHPELALEAAISMRHTFAIIQKNWQYLYGIQVGMGIGINSGPVVAGNIGSCHRLSYTVIGDTVNTASRFEKHALDGQIIFGDALLSRLGKKFLQENSITPAPLGSAQLKGKKGTFSLYTALTPDHPAAYPASPGLPEPG